MATPACKTLRPFLVHHLGQHSLGALTGQDARALEAFASRRALRRLGQQGRISALRAMSATVQAAQISVWPLFRKAIPCGLDWSDEERLWQEITA